MTARPSVQRAKSATALDRAMRRVIAEISEGVQHGFFEFAVTCEVIGQERRRLILKAGKSFQFVISKEDCFRMTTLTSDSRDESETNAT